MNIREYIDYIKSVDPQVNKPGYEWHKTFNKMNYPSVVLSKDGHRHWNQVHIWCCEQIGKEHYAWAGSRFWFDKTEDAALFALRWS